MAKDKKKFGCFPIAAIAVIILFIIGGIGSCVGGDDEETPKSSTGIEEIEFSDSEPLDLEVGETDKGYIKVEFDDEFSEEDIVFVSSDESIVTVSLSSKAYSTVYYNVEALSEGTATIRAETSDGVVKSEEITVTVTVPEKEIILIEGLEFSNSAPINLTVGESEYNSLRVDSDDDYGEEDIIFVSSDESVATITWNRKSRSLAFFDIEAVGAGTATVYAQTSDGAVKSEEIKVTVTEDEKTTTEKTTQESTAKTENSATDEPTTKKSTSRTVYRTPSGKRYHYDADCGGKNSYSVSLDDAKNAGLTPCGKCAQ